MSDVYEISGKVIVIENEKQVTETFRKRDFVLETEPGKYSQKVMFQATNDRCDILDGFRVGDELHVTFNIRGRGWQPPDGKAMRWFVSLDAWKIERSSATQRETDVAPIPEDEIPF